MQSINIISLLIVIDMLLSYHAISFAILPLIFLNIQFGIHPLSYYYYCGCIEGNQILGSCIYFQGESHEIYFELLKIKKIHKHEKVKVPSKCITFSRLHLSRNFVSISSVVNRIRLNATPFVLVVYYYLIYVPNFESNHLIINIIVTTKQPCKMKHRLNSSSGRGVQFTIWIQLACWDWLL